MNEFENKIEKFKLEFEGKNIAIEFDNFLNGIISFNDIHINYDRKNGYLRFLGKDNNLAFNTLDINYFDYKDDKVEITLDNFLAIKIIKK